MRDGLLDICGAVGRFTEAGAGVVAAAASAEEACALLLDLADVPEVADDATVVILRHAPARRALVTTVTVERDGGTNVWVLSRDSGGG